MEQFRAIPGFEGIYEVSSLGRVKSLARIDKSNRSRKERLLTIYNNPDGYPTVSLVRHGKQWHPPVHKLVALAFHGPCPEGKEVNHKDRIRTNCCADNLEYLTHAENVEHSRANGANYVTRGNARIDFERAAEIRHIKATTGRSNQSIGLQFGLGKSMIGAIIRGESW